MDLNSVNRIYFVGIGGIGMSSLAKYFLAKGYTVAGYDKTPSDLTRQLEADGIAISYADDLAVLPEEFKNNKGSLIVYTPAIPASSVLLNFFKNNNFELYKRSYILGEVSKNTLCMAVAGTHGKTSTSALLAHIMTYANTGASAFIGGILENYSSNLIIGDKDISIVEADEFDRSFLTLRPNISCITSTDADHLDIYGDEQSIKGTFGDFAKLAKRDGFLISKLGLGIDSVTYSIEGESDYVASNLRIENNKYLFDLKSPKSGEHKAISINQYGKYNVENTIAAFAMAEEFGLEAGIIIEAIADFKGVKRRFNLFEYAGKIMVDDYAHHPSEIKAVQNAAMELFAGKRVGVVFQPHLFTRTRDFEDDFAEALSVFSSVALLEIYPAREEAIEGVNSAALLKKINNKSKTLLQKEEIAAYIENSKDDVILMLGAGDIGVEINKLKNYNA